jgi:hypothetical protein
MLRLPTEMRQSAHHCPDECGRFEAEHRILRSILRFRMPTEMRWGVQG